MCIFIDPEVVLLNLLRYDHDDSGVGYRDLRAYCDRVRQALFEAEDRNVKCVSFQICKPSLDNVVMKYPMLFQACMGRYYKGSQFDPHAFDGRNSRKINRILKKCVTVV